MISLLGIVENNLLFGLFSKLEASELNRELIINIFVAVWWVCLFTLASKRWSMICKDTYRCIHANIMDPENILNSATLRSFSLHNLKLPFNFWYSLWNYFSLWRISLIPVDPFLIWWLVLSNSCAHCSCTRLNQQEQLLLFDRYVWKWPGALKLVNRTEQNICPFFIAN